MDPALGLAVAALLAAVWLERRVAVARVAMWRRVAAAQGLVPIDPVNGPQPRSLRVAREGLVVRFEPSSADGTRHGPRVTVVRGTSIVLEAPDQLPSGLALRAEGFGTKVQKALGQAELEIGDPAFDRRFRLEGLLTTVCAVLDSKTRVALGALADVASFQIRDGELRVDVPGIVDTEADTARVLAEVFRLGQALPRHEDLAAALADNARSDPERAVRLQCVRLLVREHLAHPGTRTALQACCADEWMEIRLCAALALGTDGHRTLDDVAAALIDDRLSAAAVVGLGAALPPHHAQKWLVEALKEGRVGTAAACVARLGETGGAGVEDMLLSILSRDRPHEEELRVATAEALARVGSAAAVLPLRQMAEGAAVDWRLRRASREAIAEIQSRLGRASPGQLSLAAAESGQVSLANAEPGSVSLDAEDPAGKS
jgi:hypothetical protein